MYDRRAEALNKKQQGGTVLLCFTVSLWAVRFGAEPLLFLIVNMHVFTFSLFVFTVKTFRSFLFVSSCFLCFEGQFVDYRGNVEQRKHPLSTQYILRTR